MSILAAVAMSDNRFVSAINSYFTAIADYLSKLDNSVPVANRLLMAVVVTVLTLLTLLFIVDGIATVVGLSLPQWIVGCVYIVAAFWGYATYEYRG